MPLYRPTDHDPAAPMPTEGFGLFTCNPGDEVGIQAHFHDLDEWWVFIKGKVRIMSEGEEHIVGPGDIVHTPMGEEHDIIEVLEPSAWVWIPGPLRGRKRTRHLIVGRDDPPTESDRAV